jgi:hypothetical protein
LVASLVHYHWLSPDLPLLLFLVKWHLVVLRNLSRRRPNLNQMGRSPNCSETQSFVNEPKVGQLHLDGKDSYCYFHDQKFLSLPKVEQLAGYLPHHLAHSQGEGHVLHLLFSSCSLGNSLPYQTNRQDRLHEIGVYTVVFPPTPTNRFLPDRPMM